MTVGVGSDSGTDFKGYNSTQSPGIGQLTPSTFDYLGKEYVVGGLYQQAMAGGKAQLVLMVDRPLPEHLILTVGANRFFIFEAMRMGDIDNIYLWDLESDSGWSEGDIQYPTLAEALYQEPGT